MIKEKTFNTGDIEINYAEGPESGPPLILLHGFHDRWQRFLSIMPYLILQWHVFALDSRGHGKSGRTHGRYHSMDYFSDVTAFLKHRITEPAVLFGHSGNALTSLYAASVVPEKVRAVIVGDMTFSLKQLGDIGMNEQRITYWTKIKNLAGLQVSEIKSKIKGNTPPNQLLFESKTLSSLDPDVLEFHAQGRVHELFRDVEIDAILRKISCPVLLIQANQLKGALMSNSDVELALSLNSNISHEYIEETGHYLGLETWEVAPLLRTIHSFLESL